ncbi:unnamed protein product [Boreogadus saida]
MAEAIHPRPNMMMGVRTTRGEGEERIVDILVCPESLGDQQQGSVGTEESSKSLGTGRSQRPDAVSPTKCQIWAVVVLLGLLSVVMLARLIGLAVQHTKTVSMDRDVEQLLLTLKNLTEQRDALLCKQECPDDWKKFGCKCYKTTNTNQSWNKSREFCVSHGADLVVVDSKEELVFISRYNVYFWLGATDAAGEGTWRWVDGTVLLLDNPFWSRGGPQGAQVGKAGITDSIQLQKGVRPARTSSSPQPSPSSRRESGLLQKGVRPGRTSSSPQPSPSSRRESGLWNKKGTGRGQRQDDVIPSKCQMWAVVVLLGLLSVVMLTRLLRLAVQHKTDMEQHFLTLKDLTEQRDALLCQQCCPDGWVKFGCKCYKTSDTHQSWNKSREFCVSHGADLVMVDSKEEMDFISWYRLYFWLGATDEASEGMWRWVDGTVLSLDDPSWSGGGPQGGGDKNCLGRASEQNQLKWADRSCEETNRAFCEHNSMK